MDTKQLQKVAATQYELGRIMAQGFRDELFQTTKTASAGNSLRSRWGLKEAAAEVPASYAQPKNYGGAYKADTTPQDTESINDENKASEPGSDARVRVEGEQHANALPIGHVGVGPAAVDNATANPAVSDGVKSASTNRFLNAFSG